MATYQNLVDGALRMLGRLGSGDSPSTQENTDFLVILNEMLDGWSAKLGPIAFETTDTLTWTGAAASRTIGVSGNFNTDRPLEIISAFYRRSGTDDFPIRIITHKQYQSILDKSLSQSFPQKIAYNPTFASGLGTLYLWPVPPSNTTILLTSLKPMTAVSALSNTVTLPPGYQKAIRFGLAVVLAPENGVRLAEIPEIVTEARESLSVLVALNDKPEPLVMDSLAPGGNAAYNDVDLYTEY